LIEIGFNHLRMVVGRIQIQEIAMSMLLAEFCQLSIQPKHGSDALERRAFKKAEIATRTGLRLLPLMV